MCTFNNGPRILGKIDLSEHIPSYSSRYSTCDECGKRSTYGVYIRPEHQNKQLCDSCVQWEEMAANDTCRSIFDSHDDYWDGDNGWND